MSRRQFVFDTPERFVAGTVGLPGQRTFFLQARDGRRIISVSLEKVQVAVLADRLGKLVEELEQSGLAPSAEAVADHDLEPLDEPINEAFRASILSLGWDGDRERFIVEARAVPEDEHDHDHDEDDEDVDDAVMDQLEEATRRALAEAASESRLDPRALGLGAVDATDDEEDVAVFQVALTAAATRSFVERAIHVVGAGRPPCPLCGAPLDATGHICARRNGHYVN